MIIIVTSYAPLSSKIKLSAVTKPTIAYLSMIYLLWSIICRSEYDVSTRHLRALITYWCHVCCLRLRRDDLIVDGRQMVSLISVHGRGSLSDVYGLLHFSLVPVGFTGQYFGVLHGQ